MKVYVVSSGGYYDGSSVKGIFKKRDKAILFANIINNRKLTLFHDTPELYLLSDDYDFISVDEYEVNDD